MTAILSGNELAGELNDKFPGSVIDAGEKDIIVSGDFLPQVVTHLKDTPELSFDYLNMVTAADYFDYFEVVYRLSSLKHNHSLTIKTRCHDREKPAVPSLTGLYQGADWQEREVYDLMGIEFTGHPNLKRIFLWEGFDGHPLRKDYL